ncbi:hypothetical protein VOLCADRAFT_98840 [Volvox carteri f. nagariensis]|uniref:ERD4-related membrane protein n=1 Tax=Volvox carteri f. nagariensis TaxID=3068 RepID=D8UGE9_VOLCA|nr:uncharacterized protein VOLCADRAFT_98840 [Volvox carteri f. nagariensis]EFJ41164.1 hypothetical protein VOLCADRAFT_98840 [Volvox carteri f. nagariensis]|eukprot:XP_002957732.1 hypothetical protein VOLCADRAFT_98840 [Volvox carteri f. nagariensis]
MQNGKKYFRLHERPRWSGCVRETSWAWKGALSSFSIVRAWASGKGVTRCCGSVRDAAGQCVMLRVSARCCGSVRDAAGRYVRHSLWNTNARYSDVVPIRDVYVRKEHADAPSKYAQVPPSGKTQKQKAAHRVVFCQGSHQIPNQGTTSCFAMFRYSVLRYLVSDNQVVVSVYINVLWGALCIFGFVVLRGWVRGPGGVFQRRQELQDLFMRPPRLVLGTIHQVWNWLMPLLAVSDADIVRCSGFDALVLTRVLLIGLQMFTVMTVFGIAVLIPVYYTRGGIAHSTANLGTLAQLSLANVPTGSRLFILPFFMTYIFIGCVTPLAVPPMLTAVLPRCYAQLRMAYFTCLDALPHDKELQPEMAGSVVPKPGATAADASTRSAAGSVAAPASFAVGNRTGRRDMKSRNKATLELSTRTGAADGQHRRRRDAESSAAAAAAEAAATAAACYQPAEGATEAASEQAAPVSAAAAAAAAAVVAPSVVAVRKVLERGEADGPGCGAGEVDVASGPGFDLDHGADGGSGDTAAAAAAAGGGGGDATITIMMPRMSLRSTWLNIANFFNPSLRMMLDYLDWQNPLQRTAARFGVRDLVLPTVADDEAPLPVRLYGKKERMITYDDLVRGPHLRRSEAAAAPAVATIDVPNESGAQEYDSGSGVSGGGGNGKGVSQSEATVLKKMSEELELTGGAVVLPYWRPREALRLAREELGGLRKTAAEDDGGGGGRDTATAPQLGAWGPGACAARSRKSTAAAAAAVEDVCDAADKSGNWDGNGGSEPITTAAATANTFAPYVRYGLRHRNVMKTGNGEESAVTAGVAHQLYGMTDPLQPLLPGKRNVRLLQLLQLLESGHNALAAADVVATDITPDTIAAAAAGGSGSAAACMDRSESNNSICTATMAQLGAVDVEAQAVAVAAAAAAPPLRGVAKIAHDVRRYYEMFEDPGNRLYDPLKAVHATDARGKAAKAGRRPAVGAAAAAAAGSGGGGGGTDSSAANLTTFAVSTAASGAAAAVAAAATQPPTSTRLPDIAVDSSAAAAATAAEKARADAETDPNGAAVAAVLRDLFPKSFQGLIPVTNHDAVDKLIYSWDAKMLVLASIVRDLEQLKVRHHRRQRSRVPATDIEDGKGALAASAAAAAAAAAGGVKDSSSRVVGDDVFGGSAAAAEGRLQLRAAELREEIRDLESRIAFERERALHRPAGTAYFAMFNNSQDAQMLAQCRRVVPPQGPGSLLSFDAVPAPAPDDVSWPGLWSTGLTEQLVRRAAIVLPMAVIFVLPMGPLQGALASLGVSLCGGPETFEGFDTNNKLYVDWFCEPENFGIRLWKLLLTGVLPSVVGLLWTAVCMPQLLFLCSSLTRSEVSLSGQERQMQRPPCSPRSLTYPYSWLSHPLPHSHSPCSLSGWFFWYSLFNTFLGAVLGSGVFSQLGTYLADPRKVLDKIGRALPSTANFFVQFCIARALFSNFTRLVWPHAGAMLTAIFRSVTPAVLGLCRPKSLHAAALAHMPPSTRAISYYNAILQLTHAWPNQPNQPNQPSRPTWREITKDKALEPPRTHLVFMFGCAFAVVAPVILPCCWLFFMTGFVAYRYSVLYVYERSYESGGRMWPVLCNQMFGFLLLMEAFTGTVFLVNQAWILAGVTWVTLTPLLLMFWRYCSRYYLEPMHFPPLSVVASEPRGVRLSPLVYMPPALRPGAVGWYPEQGKVWEKYGIPKHW